MNSQDIKKLILKFPDTPGVYQFRYAGKILYIGKATSLRDRVRSYFRLDIFSTRSPLIVKMLHQFDTIDFIKTDSVLEALVLEANLIKKYQPEANIKEKDNKSFNFVVITKEDFPRVLVIRSRELLKIENYKLKIAKRFGPFPNGGQLREALKIIRKMFPFRDKCIPCIDQRQSASSPRSSAICRPCFNRQIGLCPGVCTGEISQPDYARQIQNIILFFQGKKKHLMKNLEKQMKAFSNSLEFEKSNTVKGSLFALNHIQDVALIKSDLVITSETFRIESYDVAHMSGQNVVGVMTVIEDGEVKKSDYRKFRIKTATVDDTKALSEVLSRRLAHIEWRFPDLIVVDGGTAQKGVMEKVLAQNNYKISVASVVKNERHRPREILGDKKWLKYEREILLSNAEAHRFAIGFHKKTRNIIN